MTASTWQSHVGVASSRRTEALELDQITTFATAVSGPNGALRGGVPATYLTKMRSAEFELFSKMGIPLPSILHAEQEYQYLRPLRVGEVLTFEARLIKALEKSGGKLSFLTFQTDFMDTGGAKCAVSVTTVVVRGGGA